MLGADVKALHLRPARGDVGFDLQHNGFRLAGADLVVEIDRHDDQNFIGRGVDRDDVPDSCNAPSSCRHGTQLGDYIKELDGVTQPVCIIWGDQDHAAPPAVQEAYRAVPARMKNVDVHIFPGIQHGYMMAGGGKAFDQKTYDFSMQRAFEILEGLR